MERLLQRDLVVKILSALLAILLWVQVTGDQQALDRKTVHVPLRTPYLDPDLRVVSDPPPVEVLLEVSGPRRSLTESHTRNVVATLDLTGREPGSTHTIPVTIQGLPDRVQLLTKRPEWVAIRLERFVLRQVDLQMVPEDRQWIDGQYRYTLTLVDRQVNLSGLEPRVKQVAQVAVQPEFSNIHSTGTVMLPVRALDAQGNTVVGVQLAPSEVAARALVEPLPPAKVIPVKVQVAGQPPDGYTYTVQAEPAKVQVRGEASHHDRWQWAHTAAIPLNGRTRSFTATVKLEAPEGAVMLDPEEVTVHVTIGEVTVERTFTDVSVGLRNVGGNLSAQPAVNKVNVRIFGPKRLLEQLDATTLQLHLDAGGLGAGQHILPVRWVKPEGIEVLASDPPRITVDLALPIAPPPPAAEPVRPPADDANRPKPEDGRQS